MRVRNEHHEYRETGKFASLILDYLDDLPDLRSFHHGLPSVETITAALDRRRSFPVDRESLVEALRQQYRLVDVTPSLSDQIESLLDQKTYTVTTAHQCNIFLGPLYTVFKALHTIRIADDMQNQFPELHFVPVFYMGSEDADLEELNHIHLLGEKLEWSTDQRGAVGRMLVDDDLMLLIEHQSKLLGSFPYGPQWIDLLKLSYKKGSSVSEATFRLLHSLFSERGLIVLQPDKSSLKSIVKDVFWKELNDQTSFAAVSKGTDALQQLGYSPQASARPINLFYLQDGSRNRIERRGEEWVVVDSTMHWDKKQLQEELELHPERFSPNVILRGIYQESILPNLLYVGGGGELAYWLQLRPVFEAFGVPYPLLQLRASIQWMDAYGSSKLRALNMQPAELFKPMDRILLERIGEEGRNRLDLTPQLTALTDRYRELAALANSIDPTLGPHVESLRVRALNKIEELGKKMLRAEKRKLSVLRAQVESLQKIVFPGNGLQERWENLGYYYSLYGDQYLEVLYTEMTAFERSFTWLIEMDDQSN